MKIGVECVLIITFRSLRWALNHFSVWICIWHCPSFWIYISIINEYIWGEVQRQDTVISRCLPSRIVSFGIWDAWICRKCWLVPVSIIFAKVGKKIDIIFIIIHVDYLWFAMKELGGYLFCSCDGSLHCYFYKVVPRQNRSNYIMEWNCFGNRLQYRTHNWWLFLWHWWIPLTIFSHRHTGHITFHCYGFCTSTQRIPEKGECWKIQF